MTARRGAKHRVISDKLALEIKRGRVGVGELLPTEFELSKRFDVSRDTVRSALRNLRELGLVNSVQGRGTEVCAQRVKPKFSYALDSPIDILQYAKATELRIVAVRSIRSIPRELAISSKSETDGWQEISSLRLVPGKNEVLAIAKIFIPEQFSAVIKKARSGSSPYFSLIEKLYGETIVEVRQDISATTPSRDEAALLGVGADSGVLCIVRHYLNARGDTLEISRSLHRGDSFHYSMTIRTNIH